MIRITDQYVWNVIFSAFFVLLVVMGTIILDSVAYKQYDTLTFVDFTLITLASFRLIRLFVYDPVTKFFREQFYNAVSTKTGVVLEKPERGPRRTLIELLLCPWCFGTWAVASVAFFYLLTPYAFFPVLILALSGVATLIQLLANLIGWKAEEAKNKASN